ncbi:MAG: methyltransferase domain-containing protein [Candidatus Auribacterota bacterium]|nr:methyltransferase domain-containing protein [Candidatus Auribacterota bacterium]
MDVREQKDINRDNFQRHPWEIVRLEFVLNLLKKYYKKGDSPSSILDVGGGDLYVAKAVDDYFPASKVTSVDIGIPDNDCFDVGEVKVVNDWGQIHGKTYDLILLLDVLEHIEDDKEFLKGLVEKFSLRGTVFLITVPLHSFLFSEHDIKLNHKRRYAYNELPRQVRSEGLNIIREGNIFSSLWIFRIVQLIFGKGFSKKPLPGRRGSSFTDVAVWDHSALFTAIVKLLLRFDVKYTNWFPGLSGYVLANKQNNINA